MGDTSNHEHAALSPPVRPALRLALWGLFVIGAAATWATGQTVWAPFLWGWALIVGALLGEISYVRRWAAGTVVAWGLVPLGVALFCLAHLNIDDDDVRLVATVIYLLPLTIFTLAADREMRRPSPEPTPRHLDADQLIVGLAAGAGAVAVISVLSVWVPLEYLVYPLRLVSLILLIGGAFLVDLSGRAQVKAGRTLGLAGALGMVLFASGNLTFSVMDESSGVLPGASVSVSTSNREFHTDVAGRFALPFVPVGSYSVTVRMSGFDEVHRDVLVLPFFVPTADIVLEVGEGTSGDIRKANDVFIVASIAYGLLAAVCGFVARRNLKTRREQVRQS